MNPYIKLQIINMQASVRNCQEAARQAAKEDDGRTDREEERILRSLDHSVTRFLRDLKKLENK